MALDLTLDRRYTAHTQHGDFAFIARVPTIDEADAYDALQMEMMELAIASQSGDDDRPTQDMLNAVREMKRIADVRDRAVCKLITGLDGVTSGGEDVPWPEGLDEQMRLLRLLFQTARDDLAALVFHGAPPDEIEGKSVTFSTGRG